MNILIDCVGDEQTLYLHKIRPLAESELLLDRYRVNDRDVERTQSELASMGIKLSNPVNISDVSVMSNTELGNSWLNIKTARKRLSESLASVDLPYPQDDQFIVEWLAKCRQFNLASRNYEACNFEATASRNGTLGLTLAGAFILRHIMFDSGLPLVQVMNLWALFYYLIMHRPIPSDSIASQTSIWNHIHRLYYIDNILESRKFHKFISIPTPNNFSFRRYFYSSSDASQHHDRNRVVVNISTNSSPDPVKIEPSFRNITNSVTAVKTGEFMATKNMEALVKELGTEAVSHYGGGTNDNAPDAQKEIRLMFDSMMKLLEESDDDNIRELMYTNGVLRRVIAFGDPFHIANLAVTWASLAAFGDTERDNHRQVHHRQLLQSLHSLRYADSAYAQARLEEIYEGVAKFKLKTWRERVQRWLVNQRNAKYVLWMLTHKTSDGECALVEWALSYANEKSGWQQTVGQEVATWLQMPEMILALLFESEVGAYFEEVMAWHNRTGPINTRSGFRMLELFDLYFGFELPWWNQAVNDPATTLPDTCRRGEDLKFRREQIE